MMSKKCAKCKEVMPMNGFNNNKGTIGQSSSMLSRLQTHINSNKVFDSWAIVENLGEWASSEKLNSIELEYINMLKPKYNRQQIAKANRAKYRAKMKDKRKKAIDCS